MLAPVETAADPDTPTLKSIKVEGQEVMIPEPERHDVDHTLQPQDSLKGTMKSYGSSLMGTMKSVEPVKTSASSEVTISDASDIDSDIEIECPEDDASISKAVRETERNNDDSSEPVEVSVHGDDASISAAVNAAAGNNDSTSDREEL